MPGTRFWKKLSFDRRQPALTEGNVPHWLFTPKRDEPSRRIATPSRYLSLIVKFARPKNDARRLSWMLKKFVCCFAAGMPPEPNRSVASPCARYEALLPRNVSYE